MRPERLLLCLLALLATPVALAQARLPPYERVELDNGAVLLLVPHHDIPVIAFEALLRGGAAAEAEDRRGVAALTAALLDRGAGGRDAQAFVEAVADVGGNFGAGPGLEGTRVYGDFMARDADLMVELLADMLMRPRFDAKELEKVKARAVELIRAAKDSDPRGLISTYANGFLFAGHPYGHAIGGEEASLERLTRDDVMRYYGEQVGADRLVLSVAGDFEPKAMRRRLERALSAMPKARSPLAAVPARERAPGGRVLLVDKPDATQTYFWMGNVGVDKRYDKQAALELVNTVFGGRFTSMLNTELRVKSGLSYGARSSVSQPSRPGAVAIVSYTRTDASVQAIDLALETLTRLRRDGLDAAQLESAKRYVLGQYPLELETAAQLAEQVAVLEFYGLDRDYVDGFAARIEAVDLDDAREVIGEVYPAPENLVFVLIGGAKAIRSDIAKYGAVTELPITAPRFSIP